METWLDTNKDGIRQADEPAFPGVFVESHGGEHDEAQTDLKGRARLTAFIPGCSGGTFVITARVPDGYRLTTQSQFNSTAEEFGKTYVFGFTYLAGTSTVTPQPPHPRCESFKLELDYQTEISDLIIDTDHSIWLSTLGNGVAHHLPGTDKWVYYTTEDGLASNAMQSIP